MSLFDLVFGCSHRRRSFPLTTRGARRRIPAAAITRTYVVCLDCGKEFPYDWREMKIVNVKNRKHDAVSTVVVGGRAA